MKYVNKKMVIAINKLCIELTGGEEFGGKSNMYEGQSLGFVEGIVINKIFGKKRYKTIFHQAAAYLYFILKNHPFVDGNKRTALATAVTFLEWNDRIFSPFNEDEVFDFITWNLFNHLSFYSSLRNFINNIIIFILSVSFNPNPFDIMF